MKKILATMTALALTIGVQAQEETVDTAQLVAVYDYECRTQDDEAAPITDSFSSPRDWRTISQSRAVFSVVSELV